MLSVSGRLEPVKLQSNITRETKIAVNRFAIKPITKVTAKPFTCVVPNRNKNAQDTTVVKCVSMMVSNA